MKALAEFVMRGRLQALTVTVASVASSVLCWLGAAVVALVILRRGAAEGGWLLLWALLPAALLAAVYADPGPLILLAGTGALALVLRETVSLSLAVLASAMVGILSGAAMLSFAGPLLEQVVLAFGGVLDALAERLQAEGRSALELPRPTVLQVAGVLGAGNALTSVGCLLLARYWQAALYNPGGFGSEFRALALPAAAATALLVLAVALWVLGYEYRTWAMVLLVPLSYTGVALVHYWAKARGYGWGWLTGVYLLWLVLAVVRLALVVAAVADSYLHFRGRPSPPATGGPTEN